MQRTSQAELPVLDSVERDRSFEQQVSAHLDHCVWSAAAARSIAHSWLAARCAATRVARRRSEVSERHCLQRLRGSRTCHRGSREPEGLVDARERGWRCVCAREVRSFGLRTLEARPASRFDRTNASSHAGAHRPERARLPSPSGRVPVIYRPALQWQATRMVTTVRRCLPSVLPAHQARWLTSLCRALTARPATLLEPGTCDEADHVVRRSVGDRRGVAQRAGFSNLPNQVHRKSVRKGFSFTAMVVGESGLGKSSLVNALFKCVAAVYPPLTCAAPHCILAKSRCRLMLSDQRRSRSSPSPRTSRRTASG